MKNGNLILNCDYNGLISIGDNVFFNRDCSINSHKHIEIGDDCIFGENVKIYDHNHVFNRINQLIRNQGYTNENVIIGKNCWIGSNVIILSRSSRKHHSFRNIFRNIFHSNHCQMLEHY